MAKHLLDSNILIYASQPEHAGLRNWIARPSSISAISFAEVLGYPGLSDEDVKDFEAWFSALEIHQVTESILRGAAGLRRKRRMKLGDAIIAATAIEHGLELVTRNMVDFKQIAGLRLINPFDPTP